MKKFNKSKKANKYIDYDEDFKRKMRITRKRQKENERLKRIDPDMGKKFVN